MRDYGENVLVFSQISVRTIYTFILGKKSLKITNICLPMKIKYGNNENCRSTVQENPHQNIEIWCLQNTTQTILMGLHNWKGL